MIFLMIISTAENTKLTIFGKKKKDTDGVLKIENVGSYSFRYPKGEHLAIELERYTDYAISWINMDVTFSYLSNNENPVIKIIIPQYSPLQYRYHFSPPCGWMNDPNGLCFFKGYFHMFYQFNPMDTHWGDMHWGHARSRDLLSWEHLPVALYPQNELKALEEYRGGAYSGTAIADENSMRIFYTRHIGDSNSWCMEYPWTAESYDGISFENERNCFSILPPSLNSNFRDPKVFKIGSSWVMLNATREENPAVAIHSSTDLINWSYQGLFFIEEDEKYLQAECPDCFHIDGKDYLVVGYINRVNDSTRRDTILYEGHIEGFRFIAERKTIVDEGRDFYAPQTLERNGERIMIGWISDIEETFIDGNGKVNGAMSLPRRICVDANSLRIFPIKDADKLFSPPLPPSSSYITDGSYHMTIEGQANVELLTSERGNITIALSEDGTVTISHFGDIYTNRAKCIDLFMDVEVLEIFLDYGRVSYTRRVCCLNPIYNVRIESPNLSAVTLRPYITSDKAAYVAYQE